MRVLLFLILILALITPVSCAEPSSTISGVIYDYLTLEPLHDTIIEVNTTPPQVYVSKNGEYVLNIPSGTYHLTAKHYENNLLLHFTEENITVAGGGEYTLDLIMLPAIEDEFLFDEPDISDLGDLIEDEEGAENSDKTAWLVIPFVLFFIVALSLVLLVRLIRRRETSKGEDVEVVDEKPLPDDLLELVKILKKNDGRMTQKDLRGLLPYSEAKISLMITDLENRGIVTRIKRGRGNVIVLENSQ